MKVPFNDVEPTFRDVECKFSDVERTFNVAERNFLLGKSTFFLITTKTFPKINTKLILEGGRKETRGMEKEDKGHEEKMFIIW